MNKDIFRREFEQALLEIENFTNHDNHDVRSLVVFFSDKENLKFLPEDKFPNIHSNVFAFRDLCWLIKRGITRNEISYITIDGHPYISFVPSYIDDFKTEVLSDRIKNNLRFFTEDCGYNLDVQLIEGGLAGFLKACETYKVEENNCYNLDD